MIKSDKPSCNSSNRPKWLRSGFYVATGVAHEINNPLAVISGEAYMLLPDEFEKNQETRDSSKNIIEQSERIKRITTGLLEFSRNKNLNASLMDVNQDVEKSISLLTYQAKIEKIEIVKELGAGLPGILGDGDQLQEVFLNIMLNTMQIIWIDEDVDHKDL